MITLTYGVMPTPKQWNAQYRDVVGRGTYEMELVGADLDAMLEAYGDPNEGYTSPRRGPSKGKYRFTRDELYMVVASLHEEAERRADLAHATREELYFDEPSLELASAILQTLDIEWV
jgi:hypothetical protein